jgi:hypothetical protein
MSKVELYKYVFRDAEDWNGYLSIIEATPTKTPDGSGSFNINPFGSMWRIYDLSDPSGAVTEWDGTQNPTLCEISFWAWILSGGPPPSGILSLPILELNPPPPNLNYRAQNNDGAWSEYVATFDPTQIESIRILHPEGTINLHIDDIRVFGIETTTTVPPTTTAEPTTTVPPTTTAEPTTTVPPTTTAEPTTTVPPTTTEDPTSDDLIKETLKYWSIILDGKC